MIRSFFFPIEKDDILNWLRGFHSVEDNVIDGMKYDLCIIGIEFARCEDRINFLYGQLSPFAPRVKGLTPRLSLRPANFVICYPSDWYSLIFPL